ncbi:O-antigen ligase family protein [Salirhabdus salicampi]|uniref:O-antigen ligase family protein n=1 Tax=Salirhabdus salicampi TaxID=476102 RepID=UPI0020C52EB0|nr:O-antigen ligase family protein [Salirhabdus salicampi]MCP8617490.1 O-antigen ligase family protein [Salirhabdus salicampi]
MTYREGHLPNLEAFFLFFIIIQPILDVTAFFQLPIAQPVRVLAMALGVLYIALYQNKNVRNGFLIYLVIMGVFLLSHFIISYLYKPTFVLSVEVTYLTKTAYFFVMLFTYILVVRTIAKRTNWQLLIQRNIFIGMSVIGIVMLLASLTGTGKRSYDSLAKLGHSGWFYSANELSAILAMGFGIMLMYVLNRHKPNVKLMLIPSVVIIIWATLTVGTKVGLGALIITLVASMIIAFTEWSTKKAWLNIFVLLPMLIGTFSAIPLTPVGNNLGFAMSKVKQPIVVEDQSLEEEKTKEMSTKPLLSGRGDFLQVKINQYQNAPVIQKLFGMGRGGNYSDIPKLVEMDMIDWFFSYGMIGFAILLFPFLYYGWHIVQNGKAIIQHMDSSTFMVGIVVLLGFGAAFVAGHVLSSPASGIYLALFLAYFYQLTVSME